MKKYASEGESESERGNERGIEGGDQKGGRDEGGKTTTITRQFLKTQTFGFRHSVAPKSIAIGNLVALRSMPTIEDAPAAFAPMITARPSMDATENEGV